MWSYIKSFFNKKTDEKITRKITVREKSMILRHRTNNELTERSLKWTIPGWSQRYMSHTDWTIKIKDDITLPYIEPINKNCNFFGEKEFLISFLELRLLSKLSCLIKLFFRIKINGNMITKHKIAIHK